MILLYRIRINSGERWMNMIRGQFYRGMSNTSMPNRVKQVFFKILGNKIGHNVTIQNCVRFDSENIEISDGVVLNYGAQLITGGGSSKITIGENTQVGPGTIICTVSHEIGDSNKRAGDRVYKDIVIEKGVWIGANSTIIFGVTIAHGCVIGAGALVNKNTEPNGLYVGVPAKRIRDL